MHHLWWKLEKPWLKKYGRVNSDSLLFGGFWVKYAGTSVLLNMPRINQSSQLCSKFKQCVRCVWEWVLHHVQSELMLHLLQHTSALELGLQDSDGDVAPDFLSLLHSAAVCVEQFKGYTIIVRHYGRVSILVINSFSNRKAHSMRKLLFWKLDHNFH